MRVKDDAMSVLVREMVVKVREMRVNVREMQGRGREMEPIHNHFKVGVQ